MTTKTIHYDTRPEMVTGKAAEATNGFRALHTDFTNNDQAQGFDVFFDDAPGPPITPDEQRRQDLSAKLKNDTISFPELKELLRLAGII